MQRSKVEKGLAPANWGVWGSLREVGELVSPGKPPPPVSSWGMTLCLHHVCLCSRYMHI